jgi:hypothetical protein
MKNKTAIDKAITEVEMGYKDDYMFGSDNMVVDPKKLEKLYAECKTMDTAILGSEDWVEGFKKAAPWIDWSVWGFDEHKQFVKLKKKTIMK